MNQSRFARAVLAGSITMCFAWAGNAAFAKGQPPAPAVGKLGSVIVNPYGNAPLTAIINLAGKSISDVKVTVHGRGERGVSISYPVGPSTLLSHDGVPVFGLYQRHANRVSLEYTLEGRRHKDDYVILTGSVQNRYMDNRSVTEVPRAEVKQVAPGFEDRLYLVNGLTQLAQGTDLAWAGKAPKGAGKLDPEISMGAMGWDFAPINYVVDTQGEIRWWFSQDALYDGVGTDVAKRGTLMGFNPTQRGTFTASMGQMNVEFNLMGQVLQNRLMARGYVDLGHEAVEMPNGNLLVRGGKRNYVRADGDVVHTVRDHIIELDRSGNVVDVWSLPTILDALRDSLLGALDMGAVCISVDIDSAGQKAKIEPNTPFGDSIGVGPGRNWAHVNSVAYDAKDDSIVLSVRHQGVVKIGRDKQVKWILSPRAGWTGALAQKVLKPVDAKGKPIECTEKGECQSGFDFTYTQHTAWLSPKGTVTVFDNGDARHYDQPAMPTMKYSRFVEYKIDEKNLTVEQVWEYGKDRGYEWYSPITSNVEFRADRNTMFGFGGSVGLFERGKPTIGRINEVDYGTKQVKVEIDVHSDKKNAPHYRALIVEPARMFGR